MTKPRFPGKHKPKTAEHKPTLGQAGLGRDFRGNKIKLPP